MDAKIPKYAHVKESIKKEITSGKYEANGGRLPTCRELVKIYEVSYLTANKAMKELQEEGFAKLIQGKGIFATKPVSRRKSSAESKNIGFFISSKGVFYKDIFPLLARELEANNFHAVLLPSIEELEKNLVWERDEKLEKITNGDFAAFVVEGNRNFQFKALKKYSERIEQLIFAVNFDSSIEFQDASFAVSNFYKGGVMAADHLIKNNHAPFAMIAFDTLSEEIQEQYGSSAVDYDAEIIEGINASFEKHSLEFASNLKIIIDSGLESNKAEVKKLLSSGIKGFIALDESSAAAVYSAARDLNLLPGRDISVIGYFTPSIPELFEPELTFLSLREDEIAEAVMKTITKKAKGRNVRIEPRLSIRKS